MPNTITVYYEFTASTKARASQVNANFSNHRGHRLPIDPTATSATTDTYNLGSEDYRWLNVFANTVDLKSSTSTASLTLSGDTAATTGAFAFKIEGTTKARITTNGIDGAYIQAGSVLLAALGFTPHINVETFTANGTFTAPTATTYAICFGWAGGGGGQGGSSAETSNGGAGAPAAFQITAVTPGNAYSITIGSGGGGGAASGGAGAGSSGSTGNDTTFSTLLTWTGGGGGAAGQTLTRYVGGNAEPGYYSPYGYAPGAVSGSGIGGGGGPFGSGGQGNGTSAGGNSGAGGGGGNGAFVTGGNGGSGKMFIFYVQNT
jgi:hypothetical protein